MPYEFLTEEWMAEAKRLRDEAGPPETPPAHTIRMNQIITGAPFNDGADIHVFMDTTDGEVNLDLGELENPDLTVTVDYDTAKAIFVEQNAAGRDAGLHGRQDQGAGRHDQDDGHAADAARRRRHRPGREDQGDDDLSRTRRRVMSTAVPLCTEVPGGRVGALHRAQRVALGAADRQAGLLQHVGGVGHRLACDTSGTVTIGGPLDTTRVTVESRGTWVPAAGVTSMT